MNVTAIENVSKALALQPTNSFAPETENNPTLYSGSGKSVDNQQKTSDAGQAGVDLNPQEQKLREISDKIVKLNESLVIEKDPQSQGFIYKTVDKSTGEVLKIWPEASFLDKVSSIPDVDTRGIVMNDLV